MSGARLFSHAGAVWYLRRRVVLYSWTPHLPCRSLYSSEQFLKNRCEVYWAQEPACKLFRQQRGVNSQHRDQKTIYISFIYVSTILLVWLSLEVSGRIMSSNRPQHLKAPSSPSFGHTYLDAALKSMFMHRHGMNEVIPSPIPN